MGRVHLVILHGKLMTISQLDLYYITVTTEKSLISDSIIAVTNESGIYIN